MWGCLLGVSRVFRGSAGRAHARCAAVGHEEVVVGRRMWRIAAAGVAAGVAALGVQAVPALAAAGGTGHTVTQTVHQHGTWTETGDNDFCTGELISPTITGNSVEHVTYFPAGDEAWGTFTTEGVGSFVQ